MKIVRSPSINPDHDNDSIAGKAWKDRANGVKELSAQIPSDELPLKDDSKRHARQRGLLAAQLNAFIDDAATPARWSRTAIGNSQDPHIRHGPRRLRLSVETGALCLLHVLKRRMEGSRDSQRPEAGRKKEGSLFARIQAGGGDFVALHDSHGP